MSKDIEKSSMARLLGGLTGEAPSLEAGAVTERTDVPRASAPQSHDAPVKKRYDKSSPAATERVSTILDSVLMEKVKTISKMEGVTIRAILEYSLFQSVELYERKYGRIKVKKAKKGNVSDIFQD